MLRLSVDHLANGYAREAHGKGTLPLEDVMHVWLIAATRSIGSGRQPSTLCESRPSQPMRFPILQVNALEHADAALCDAWAQMVKEREHEAEKEIWGLLPCIANEVVSRWAGQCSKHCTALVASGVLPDSDSEDLE
ncbi:hypothetical protein GSI_12046 [Ganoderma sinense ZZ0214-1]|uniref:Uncharacterized protein n=1 Tax=Ganoderma sinense ZZ0214-1 TaxID=1077348 RepID=A0A2G8RXP8_9APHY|nr:hypothetical protein GSI_12046 [Ganoderma sinense ZZ0214-1]